MKRTLIKDTPENIDKEVIVKGWVDKYRSHGKMVFLDLRDVSGILQVVFLSNLDEKILNIAKSLAEEYVIEIKGKINKRPDNNIKEDMVTGTIEMEASDMKIISKCKPLPIPINGDGYDINEEKRLKYRYLDLRRKRINNNIKMRQALSIFIRNYLSEKGFFEIETPIMTKSTPEGARDFLVPSRLQAGEFYALPQSPQQYKQLLMIAGFEKYFQLARCFRDEDLRSDRLFELTQMDLEMSFVDQEDILSLIEPMMIEISEKVFNKKIKEIPFPRITYDDAIKKYNNDRPDLREEGDELAFCWIIDFPMFERQQKGNIDAVHHPFTSLQDKDLEEFKKMEDFDEEKLLNMKAKQYDLVLNGSEIMGGSIRTHDRNVLKRTFEVLGHSPEGVEEKFGHLLEAFDYGVPPHGGIAAGFDRMMQTFLGEKNIRDVVAFPTNTAGVTSVMDAPSKVSNEQLKELGIKVVKKQ